MGRGSEQRIQLRRDNPGTAWGFRLQGGKDFNVPLSVQRVFNGSPSDGQLQRGDVILSVDNRDVTNLPQNQAQELMKSSGLVINIAIARDGDSDFGSDMPQEAVPHNNFHQQSYAGDYPKAYSSSPERSTAAKSQQAWTPQQTYQPPAQFSPPQSAPSYGNNQASFGPQSPSHADRYSAPQPTQLGQPGRHNAGPSLDYNTDNQNFYDPPPASSYRTPTTSFTPQQPETRKATATHTFAQQSPPFQGDSWGGDRSQSSNDHYETHGPTVIQREEDEEGYEQHSVGDIKQMFNKPDQTGQRVTPHIRRAQPKAPMWKSQDDHSHQTRQFDSAPHPAPIKSSLTPSSRPGSIQRGAPDNHSSSYIPMNLPDTHTHSQVKRPGQYGYAIDPAPALAGKYVGGFVGVSALTKPLPKPAPLPKKTPPGQKKKDFDPTQSSVLRVLQEEEERAKNNPHGQQQEEEEEEPRRPQPAQQRRQPQGQQQRQQPGQQRQQQSGGGPQSPPRRAPPPAKSGASLQALLDRDQVPSEDRSREHSVTSQDHGVGAPVQGGGEYRRPGTNFKPSQVKVAPQAGSLEDYPFPESMSRANDSYDYPASSYPTSNRSQSNTGGYPGAGSYQPSSNYQSSSYPHAQPSGRQADNHVSSSAQYPASNYPTGNYKGGNYPSTDYDAQGIPASDF